MTLAMPKSSSFTLAPSERGLPVTSRLPGFTSRCATPRWCAASSAIATGPSRRMASSRLQRDLSRSRYRSSASPSSHSSTMYGSHSPLGLVYVPTSQACTMPVDTLDSSASSAPSRTNASCSAVRSSPAGSASALKNLMATGFFQIRWRARYTTEKPPIPATCSMSYFCASVSPWSPSGSASLLGMGTVIRLRWLRRNGFRLVLEGPIRAGSRLVVPGFAAISP